MDKKLFESVENNKKNLYPEINKQKLKEKPQVTLRSAQQVRFGSHTYLSYKFK